MASESILTSTKKLLGIDEEYDVFDLDIMFHINSAFFTLSQLGIGPSEGFVISDKTAVWTDFIENIPQFSAVKTYVPMKVRLGFDPPITSFAIDAIQKQLVEMEWRLSANREIIEWTPPDNDVNDSSCSSDLIDGGLA